VHFGVITAMPAEARTFRGHSSYSGQSSWHVATAAAGQKNSMLSAKNLLEQGCDFLISWGVAGALDPQLDVGELIITNAVIDNESQYFRFDPDRLSSLTRTLKSLNPKVGGLLYSTKEAVPLATEKQELHEKFHAEVVDMESAAIAKVAYDAKIDFVAIRCIVDRADCDIPMVATSTLKENGEVDIFQLLASLAQNPRQIVPLMRLGFNYYSALRHLKKAATLLQQCL
jgi:adenosylhomocysteine nucleosidase